MATGGFDSGIDPTRRIGDMLRRVEAEVDGAAAAHQRLRGAVRRVEDHARRMETAPVARPVAGPAGTPARGGGGTVLVPGGAATTGPPRVLPSTQPVVVGLEKEARATQAVTGAKRAYTSTTLQQTSAMAAYNRHTQQSGALTSQFLAEAQAGRATLRQFGDEARATAGKFGGWLVAGSAIYGLLGAVSTIGKGAMDSASGVRELHRSVNDVKDDEASARYRSLARKFNLPIETVSEAGVGMGAVFHNQADTFVAMEAALAGIATGGLSASDSIAYLSKITTGFQGDATDLIKVLDAANVAQNRYNTSIQDMLAGTQKAAGQWHASGGDRTSLMALITTGMAAGAGSGLEVGTGLRRSANQMRKEQNAAVLRAFSLEPDLPIDEFYRQAIEKAPSLDRQQLQNLANAIGGPDLGSKVILPILSQPETYKKAMKDLADENAAGESMRELAILAGRLNARVKSLVSDLEAMGSALDGLGAFDGLKALVGVLGLALGLTNNLLEVFNALPEPLRLAVSYLGQAALAMKAMRFVNMGSSMPEGSFLSALLANPNEDRKLLDRALGETDEALGREALSNQRDIKRAYRERDLWNLDFNEASEKHANLLRGGNATEKEIARSKLGVLTQEEGLTRTEARIAQLKKTQLLIEEDRAATASAQAALVQKQLSAEQIARQHGIVTSSRIGMGKLDEAEELRRKTGGTTMVYGDWRGSELKGAAGRGGPWDAQKLDDFRREGGRFGIVGAGYRRTMDRVKDMSSRQGSILNAGMNATKAAGRGLLSLGRGVVSFLGPVGLAIAGLMFLPEAISQFNKQIVQRAKNLRQGEAALGAVPKNVEAFEKQIADLEKGSGLPDLDAFKALPHVGLLDGLLDIVDGVVADTSQVAETLGKEQERVLGELKAGNVNLKATPGTLFSEHLKAEAERLRADESLSPGELSGRMRILHQIAEANNVVFEDAKATLDEAEQDEVALIEARGKLMLARATGDVEKARVTLQTAQRVASAVKANPKSDQADLLNAQAEVVNAQNALQDQVAEEARKLEQAEANLWVSRARTKVQAARRAVKVAVDAFKRVATDAQASAADLLAARQTLEEAKREAADEIAREAIDIGKSRDDLRLSLVSGDLARAKVEVENAARQLQRVQQNPLSDPNEQAKALIGAQVAYNDALRAVAERQADDARETASAYDQLWVSQSKNDRQEHVRQVEVAKRAFDRVNSDPDATQAERIDAYRTVVEAQKSLDDFLEQQAQELQASVFELARAKAGDNPVRVAAIAAREAEALLGDAETRAEKNSGRARLIDSRRSYEEQVAQSKLSDIQFDADMERITTQQHINRLKDLLQTTKAGREFKRGLMRQIHQLENQDSTDSFGLDVGQIKLPTMYDIRRAIKGGRSGGPQPGFQMVNNNAVTINVATDNPDEVLATLNDALVPNRSAMQSAGII